MRFGFRGVRMIKKRNHSRIGWVAITAIAGVALLAGIAPSASASDRSAKTARSCCKQPMRTALQLLFAGDFPCDVRTDPAVIESPVRRASVRHKPVCACARRPEVPVPSPKPAPTEDGNRTGRERSEPARRCAVSLAIALKSAVHQGPVHLLYSVTISRLPAHCSFADLNRVSPACARMRVAP